MFVQEICTYPCRGVARISERGGGGEHVNKTTMIGSPFMKVEYIINK